MIASSLGLSGLAFAQVSNQQAIDLANGAAVMCWNQTNQNGNPNSFSLTAAAQAGGVTTLGESLTTIFNSIISLDPKGATYKANSSNWGDIITSVYTPTSPNSGNCTITIANSGMPACIYQGTLNDSGMLVFTAQDPGNCGGSDNNKSSVTSQ